MSGRKLQKTFLLKVVAKRKQLLDGHFLWVLLYLHFLTKHYRVLPQSVKLNQLRKDQLVWTLH